MTEVFFIFELYGILFYFKQDQIWAHVNKIPTSCFRLNVFQLKQLNK